MVHHRLGNVGEARYWLRQAEQHGEQLCRAHLRGDSLSLPGFSWPPASAAAGWSDWPHYLGPLREARQLVRGTAGEDEPWFRLVRARAYALLDRPKQAEREFRHASLQPGEVEAWLVRGRAHVRLGQHGPALAAFDRAVEAGQEDPRAWVARGRYHLERGRDAKADADFARAAALAKGDLTPFLEAGWWVAGPYPEELERFCPPEKDPHPSRPAPDRDGKGRRWRPAPAEADGRVELGTLFGGAEHISAYALNYCYAVAERDVTLYIGSDDTVRVWLNGTLVHEYPAGREAVPRQDTVRVTLKAGRNVLLVKVGNGIVEHRFYLSAGGPFDRGLARAERGLWREAAALTGVGLEAAPAEHVWPWVQDCVLKRAAGDEAGYRRAVGRLMERYGRSPSADTLTAVARACALGPDAVRDAGRLVEMALREEAKENGRVAHVALARYRAGQPERAVKAIQEGAADDWPVAWPVLALAHHRLGHKDEARRWLDQAEEWVDDALDQALAGPAGRLPLAWIDWAEFQVLRREARQALGAGTTRADEKLKRLEDRARAGRK
jgi:Flp pilus assembly protein TadD